MAGSHWTLCPVCRMNNGPCNEDYYGTLPPCPQTKDHYASRPCQSCRIQEAAKEKKVNG